MELQFGGSLGSPTNSTWIRRAPSMSLSAIAQPFGRQALRLVDPRQDCQRLFGQCREQSIELSRGLAFSEGLRVRIGG